MSSSSLCVVFSLVDSHYNTVMSVRLYKEAGHFFLFVYYYQLLLSVISIPYSYLAMYAQAISNGVWGVKAKC